jgi:sugar phosphate isomerase/epimerase
MVDYGRQAGVAVVYENHDQAGVMQYQDFSAPQQVFLAIYEATAECGLGINYDTANATVLTPDPLYLLECVLERVAVLHASDAYWGAEGHRWCTIGQGIVPFDAIFRRLGVAHWDGWISIEEASGTGRRGIEQGVRFVRQAWEASKA